MSKRRDIPVSNLLLNQLNPRTGECSSQVECMLAIQNKNATQYYKLIESILKTGFLNGEAILVKKAKNSNKYIVEEGNRRISILKLLLAKGEFRFKKEWPSQLAHYVRRVSDEKRKAISKVNCIIYDDTDDDNKLLEAEIANRHLTGKANNASRLDWPSFYVARRERDLYGKKSAALDLLEKFFVEHQTIENTWAPDYDITVLEDFLTHLASYLKYDSKKDLADDYPNDETKKVVDSLITDIYTKGKEGITNLATRRDINLAREFFGKYYPITQIVVRPVVVPKPVPVVSPTTPPEGEPPLPPEPVPTAPRVNRPSSINPEKAMEKACDELMSLSNEIGEIKLSQAFSELKFHLKQKRNKSDDYRNPISIAVIMRAVFDYSAQRICTAHGISIPSKVTVGCALDLAKKVIADQNVKDQIEVIKNRSIIALHTFVHATGIFPPDSDLKAIFIGLHPIMKHFLEIVRDKKLARDQRRT